MADTGYTLSRLISRWTSFPWHRWSVSLHARRRQLQAHEAYLRFADRLTGSLAKTLAFQLSLQEALGDGSLPIDTCPE